MNRLLPDVILHSQDYDVSAECIIMLRELGKHFNKRTEIVCSSSLDFFLSYSFQANGLLSQILLLSEFCLNFRNSPSVQYLRYLYFGLFVCVAVLLPSQPNGSCRARSVYLTTLLLGRHSLNKYCAHSFARNSKLPFLKQRKRENDRRNGQSARKNVADPAGVEPVTPDHQSAHPIQPPRPAYFLLTVFVSMD